MPHLFVPLTRAVDSEFFQKMASYVEHDGDHYRNRTNFLWGVPYATSRKGKSGRHIKQLIRQPYSPEEGAKLCEKPNAQMHQGSSPCLYLYDPKAKRRKLILVEPIESMYTQGEMPPPDKCNGLSPCGLGPHVYGQDWADQYENWASRPENPVYCDLWFRIETVVPIADRNIPRETMNLVYADDSVGSAGSAFVLSDSMKVPILVDQKNPKDYFDRIPISSFIPRRDQALPLDLHYKRGQEGNKYGTLVHNFFVRIWEKVHQITSIRLYAEQKDAQVSSYSPEPGHVDIIKGRKAFKSGKRNYTLKFRLFTTCVTDEQQERLIRHLRRNFLD